MPPLVIPGTVRVNLVWTRSGAEYAVNVLHYLVPSGQVVTGATATDLAADIGNAFGASTLDNWIENAVALSRVSVRDIRTANLPEFNASLTAGGLSVSDPLPLGVALCATFRTALAGRRFRGRFYMPGWAENANTSSGVADVGAVADLETFLTNISSPTVEGNLWTLGVMSQAEVETNPVIAIECRDAVWDTQRRRAVPGI